MEAVLCGKGSCGKGMEIRDKMLFTDKDVGRGKRIHGTVSFLLLLLLLVFAGEQKVYAVERMELDIPVVGSISRDDGSLLYVVDLADYEPGLELWDYKVVTAGYGGENLTFLSDQGRNIRVILTMDERKDFYLFAFKEETQSFYPVNKLVYNGAVYYFMSPNACMTIPEGLTEELLGDNTIFYAVNAGGAGGFYRRTSDGVLEEWKAETSDGEKAGRFLIFPVLGIFLAVSVAAGVILLRSHLVAWKDIRAKGEKLLQYLCSKKQYLFVIHELTSREIKRKYARSRLGILWSVLNPLLMMIVMTMVFSYMFKRSIENFPLYYLTGSLLWTLFNEGTNHSMSALVDNKTLLLKAKLPRQTFVLSRMYTALVNLGFSCVPYVLMLVVFRIKPSWTMLLFPLDVLLVMIFSMGIGYLLSILYVFFADIRYLYGVFLRILLYLTAVFYPVSSLPETLQKVVGFNPVYMSIYIARECMVYGRAPHYTAWLKLFLAAVISFAAGWTVFNRKQNDVMQRI